MPDNIPTVDIPGSVNVTTPASVGVYAPGAANGVSFTTPPADMVVDIAGSIQRALATLPAGKKGGLVTVYSKNDDGTSDANAAVVQRLANGDVDIDSIVWIGKKWRPNADGSVHYGVGVTVSW